MVREHVLKQHRGTGTARNCAARIYERGELRDIDLLQT